MAGVGFKLNKIFEKKTITAGTLGVLSSPLTVIGPTFFFLIVMFSVNGLLRMWQVSDTDVSFFITTFTNISLVAILISAFVGPVLSRYISDKVFEEKEGDVSASLYGMMLCGSIVAAFVGGFLCFVVRNQNGTKWTFLVLYYLSAVLLVNLFNLSVYMSVIKKYFKICIAYAAGLIVFLIVTYICYPICGLEVGCSLYLAISCSLLIMDLLLVCFSLMAFGAPGKKYFDFMQYFARCPYLVWSGMALFVGLFVSNMLQYNTGIFMAILIHLPGMVVFEIIMKGFFYGKYTRYLSVIQNGTFDLIDKERETLQNCVRLQLFLVYGIQLTVTLVSVALVNVLARDRGFASEQVDRFIMLAIGMFFVFCMYDVIIILYYFSGYKEAGFIATVFAMAVVIATLVCGELGAKYYILPLPLGGMVGWIASSLILKIKLRNINAFILCK